MPEQLENATTEECYWEVQKFLDLALRANPNVLECLYTPLVEQATPLARELLDLRAELLSKLAYQTFNGYVLSQALLYVYRVLLTGIHLMRTGKVEATWSCSTTSSACLSFPS